MKNQEKLEEASIRAVKSGRLEIMTVENLITDFEYSFHITF